MIHRHIYEKHLQIGYLHLPSYCQISQPYVAMFCIALYIGVLLHH